MNLIQIIAKILKRADGHPMGVAMIAIEVGMITRLADPGPQDVVDALADLKDRGLAISKRDDFGNQGWIATTHLQAQR